MGTIAIGVGICMGLAALGVGIGQGFAANGGLTGMAKQPEMMSKLVGNMIVAMAIMETAVVLAFVIAIMLIGKM